MFRVVNDKSLEIKRSFLADKKLKEEEDIDNFSSSDEEKRRKSSIARKESFASPVMEGYFYFILFLLKYFILNKFV